MLKNRLRNRTSVRQSTPCGLKLAGPCSENQHRIPTRGCLKERHNPQQCYSRQQPELHKPPIQKKVRFQDVYIREYERVLGDNPSCSSGAPIRYVIGNALKQTASPK
jgi:hypothetical protein